MVERNLTYDEAARVRFLGRIESGKLELSCVNEKGEITKMALSKQETGELLSLLYDCQREILGSEEDSEQGEEPTLVECPYCLNHHYSNQVENCPLKPKS